MGMEGEEEEEEEGRGVTLCALAGGRRRGMKSDGSACCNLQSDRFQCRTSTLLT
jgi:hypothetical protein